MVSILPLILYLITTFDLEKQNQWRDWYWISLVRSQHLNNLLSMFRILSPFIIYNWLNLLMWMEFLFKRWVVFNFLLSCNLFINHLFLQFCFIDFLRQFGVFNWGCIVVVGIIFSSPSSIFFCGAYEALKDFRFMMHAIVFDFICVGLIIMLYVSLFKPWSLKKNLCYRNILKKYITVHTMSFLYLLILSYCNYLNKLLIKKKNITDIHAQQVS